MLRVENYSREGYKQVHDAYGHGLHSMLLTSTSILELEDLAFVVSCDITIAVKTYQRGTLVFKRSYNYCNFQ